MSKEGGTTDEYGTDGIRQGSALETRYRLKHSMTRELQSECHKHGYPQQRLSMASILTSHQPRVNNIRKTN